jgi:Fe(3+) dicitrate transport protein
MTEEVGILAGVYRGFTAAVANSSGETDPELSTNFELGTRYSGFGQGEVIAFLNDYSQFSGTCSFSQGSCNGGNAGEQSNAGSASVYGLEASWGHALALSGFLVPFSTSYTFTHGEFGEEFVDSSGAFGEKGQVIEAGYEIGYLPEHRLNAQIGLEKDAWKINASLLYQSEMRNVPGEGSIAEADLIEEHTLVDLSASYQAMPALQLYSTIDNIFDEQYVAGVKPYGFRPGKPRSVNLGAKYQF